MIIIERIQRTIGKTILRRRHKKNLRNRFTHNLNSANKVGIVCIPANKEELNIIKGFLEFLSKLEIKVFPLAYIEPKKNDIEVVLEKRFKFVDRKDFNWYYKPFTTLVKDFINEEFDILISLCMRNVLPVNFVIGQSKAKLKVGKLFKILEVNIN